MSVMSILPKKIRDVVSENFLENLEEIRIRIGQPVELIAESKHQLLPYIATKEDANQLLGAISEYSFYAMEEELRRGFITIEGGHRIGICGRVITDQGLVKGIRDIASFNIRIAKQKIGVANELVPFLYESYWKNTMIIGSPQTGKTTILRDIVRIISSGIFGGAKKVGIVDERSEIAGCVNGIPSFQFGARMDVLDACPKAEGMMMLIRSMSPDVLVVDEIGRKEDSEAILEAVHAGVNMIVTAHGMSAEDVIKRPTMKSLMEEHVFERYVELSNTKKPGTILRVLDKDLKNIWRKSVT